jgi:hypothetical protein
VVVVVRAALGVKLGVEIEEYKPAPGSRRDPAGVLLNIEQKTVLLKKSLEDTKPPGRN